MSQQIQAMRASFPPPLYARITRAISLHPDPNELTDLMYEWARTVQMLMSSSEIAPTAPIAPTGNVPTGNSPTNAKKRKLDESAAVEHTNGSTAAPITNVGILYECKDVSFQIPARKKFKLQLVCDANDKRRQEIRLQNQQSKAVEHTLPADQIEQAFCLPVPEKQQRQWNFVLFPKAGAVTADGMPCEQVVFTMNESHPAGASAVPPVVKENDTFVTVTEEELNKLLLPHGKHVVMPNALEFASSIPQSHRKGEKAYHVKAHRGSKEGFLFFLDNGIVFGFKKPLAFFPFSSIDSVSYTSVLQRTFNLVIAARESEEADVKEVEFSMLDQADFAGIDEYIKRHGLNDASMAADRRAKAYNVNKDKKAAEANGDAGAGGADESELAKAEQQLQDEEDEEEEDYEASGGESDGEGEYSDDEEDEYGDAGDEEGAEEVEHEEDVHDE